MAKSMNLQKTVIATRENLNIGSIVNQALIDILIAKQIITEEEMLYYIGKISTEKVNIIKRLS
jgi:hypothetical protein